MPNPSRHPHLYSQSSHDLAYRMQAGAPSIHVLRRRRSLPPCTVPPVRPRHAVTAPSLCAPCRRCSLPPCAAPPQLPPSACRAQVRPRAMPPLGPRLHSVRVLPRLAPTSVPFSTPPQLPPTWAPQDPDLPPPSCKDLPPSCCTHLPPHAILLWELRSQSGKFLVLLFM